MIFVDICPVSISWRIFVINGYSKPGKCFLFISPCGFDFSFVKILFILPFWFVSFICPNFYYFLTSANFWLYFALSFSNSLDTRLDYLFFLLFTNLVISCFLLLFMNFSLTLHCFCFYPLDLIAHLFIFIGLRKLFYFNFDFFVNQIK